MKFKNYQKVKDRKFYFKEYIQKKIQKYIWECGVLGDSDIKDRI